MTELDRRSFLKTSAAVAAGTAIGAGPFQGLLASPAFANHTMLVPAPDMRDGKFRLHVPPGFSYRSFHDTEIPAESMLDEWRRRFPGDTTGWRRSTGPATMSSWCATTRSQDPAPRSRPTARPMTDARGAARRLWSSASGVSPRVRIASQTGTLSNCSGGPMPWGAWITCEETVNGSGRR